MERASPAALAKFRQQVRVHNIPYWGPACVVQILNLADGRCVTFLMGPCSPCRSFHFVCHTLSSFTLNLLTSADIAPRLTIQGIISLPTNFKLNLQQKAIPPAAQSPLPPPLWPCCSQVAYACLLPPPWPSCSLPAGITTTATTQATLTPLGLITGKATDHGLIAISTNPATTQATLTAVGRYVGDLKCLATHVIQK
jgi:hypothetical protein